MLSGIEETFQQMVHARCSYVADQIMWNARFRSIYPDSMSGSLAGDIGRLHDVEPA